MSNKVTQPEVRNATYFRTNQKVQFTSSFDGHVETEEASFTINGHTARIIFQDKYTVVLLDNKFKGVSECMEGDNFSRRKGLKIAYNRALIQALEAETKKLAHE